MNKSKANELREALGDCKQAFVFAGIFSFFINMLMLVPSFYMLQVYDRVVASGSKPTLTVLTLIMVFLLTTMGGLEWVRSRILVRVSSRLDGTMADRLYNLSFRQALYSSGTATEAQPLKDLNGLRTFLTGNGFFAFFDAPWLPIYLGVMFMFHFWYGVAGTIAAVILVIIAFANEKSTAGYLAESARQQQHAQNIASTNLRNAEVIESMGMLDNIRARWKTSNQDSIYWQSTASDHAGTFTSTSKVFRQIMQSLILGLGALLVINQEITPGLMIAGSILLGRALAPIDLMINSWKMFVQARGQFSRLDSLLDKVPRETENMTLPEPQGQVAFEQVVIAPPLSQSPVIKGVSFEINKGELVAIIGPSGSGKTSLARGMLGIWPARAGTVRIDGADINHYNRSELGPFIGYLPQDIELFAGTVSENIARFGEVDPDKVVAAARAAGVHDLILQLPGGYDTPIGVGGSSLSAGQRQRIGLARALYGDPVLVVLDEPNSNLDDVGEVALAEAVKGLKEKGSTTVLITHRPKILSLVDKIMLMANGGITAFDSREAIMAAMQQARAQATQPQKIIATASNASPKLAQLSKD